MHQAIVVRFDRRGHRADVADGAFQVADRHVIARGESLTNVLARQDAGHRVAAAQAKGQSKTKRQTAEGNQ